MAFETASFNTTLAAAAGDDVGLMRELRQAYAMSITQQLDFLTRSRCDANWIMAASRLRSLAAGFHDVALMGMADAARAAAPGEPTVISEIGVHLEKLERRATD